MKINFFLAYEVLSDDNLRAQYDQLGHNSYEQNSRHSNGPGNSGNDGGDFNFDEFFKNFDEAFKQHTRQHEDAHFRAHENAKRQHEKIVRDQHRQQQHGGFFQFNFDDLFDDADNDFFKIHGDGGFGGFGNDFAGFNGFPATDMFNDIHIEKCKC